MKTYKWRSDNWQNEDEWDEIEAYDMKDAAEKVLTELHADGEVDEIDLVIATCGLGRKKRFYVSAEYDINFYARELAN